MEVYIHYPSHTLGGAELLLARVAVALSRRDGFKVVVSDFADGVLAVAIASPCTAPFMGASLGLAVTLPTAQALLVFAALGFGMALPYLAMAASKMPVRAPAVQRARLTPFRPVPA